jgi:hydrogenase/urease accessory protein HupE
LFVLMLAPMASAHEMGSTRVNALFRHDGTYQIDILVDPQTLLDRLTLLAGGKRLPPVPVAELPARITAQAPLLLQQTEVTFDGKRVTPRFTYVPVESSPDAVTAMVRLQGDIPPHAQSFLWRYTLPYSPYMLTVTDEATPGEPKHQWIEGDAAAVPVALGKRVVPLTRWETVLLYLQLGFTHIVPKGLDHILFVLGIFLLSMHWRPLLAQVTAFTIAHSVTLALSMYQVIALPSRIVEPAIALSIAYVGFENVLTRTVKPWRIALVFAFGLLHGLGFAGVLANLGLPPTERVTALIAFNAGVELGQLSVIAVAFLAIASWARRKAWYRGRVVVPGSIIIGVVGLYWVVERAFLIQH